MKIRNGFVSNSSSSSFVVLLPDDFDINTIDFQVEIDKCKYADDAEPENVKKALQELISSNSLFNEDYYDSIYVIKSILKPYIVASIEGGPDDGSITLLDNKKVKKILNIS